MATSLTLPSGNVIKITEPLRRGKLFVYFMATSCRQRRGDVTTKLPEGNVAMNKWRLIGNAASGRVLAG